MFYVEEPFSFKVAVVNHTRLNLVAITGSIDITGSSQTDSVVVTGTRRVGARSVEEAKQHLPDLEVDVQDSGTEVFVITTQPQHSQGRNYEVDYTITLPDTLTVNVSAVTGAVTTDSIANAVAVNHVTGTVQLDDIVGSASVRLITGTIESKVTMPLYGEIDMSTITGNINLDIPGRGQSD
jgi:hypothetical protein